MIQIVTFKIKNCIERLSHADHLDFYNDEIIAPISDVIPDIFILVRVYNILKALLKREEYLACRSKGGIKFIPHCIYDRRSENRSLKEARLEVDEAFFAFISVVNAACIISKNGCLEPDKEQRLSQIIRLVNAAPLRLHSNRARNRADISAGYI